MKRPGKKLRYLVAAIVVGPPLLWGLIVLMLPMQWARNCIVSKLEAETGQDVQLAGVCLRILGGVRLTDLQFASKGARDNPWLKVESIVVDVNAGELVYGKIAPTHVDLSGVDLRVHRDRDGRLEFEDLFEVAKAASAGRPANNPASDEVAELSFTIDQTTMRVVDETTDTRLEFSEIQGQGTFDGGVASVDAMSGRLNGGTIDMAAKLDSERGRMAIEGEIRARDVALGVGMKSLAYAIPLLAQAVDGTSAEGQLDLDLYVKSNGNKTEAIVQNLTGRGNMSLDGLRLDNSRVISEFTKFLPNMRRHKLGSMRGDFEILKRRVQTENTVLNVGDLPVNLAGWSDFDGNLDYVVKCEDLAKKVHSLAAKLPAEARELLDELPVEQLDGLVNLELTGTIEHPEVRARDGSLFSKKNPRTDPSRRSEERARLKEAGKRFLDRVIR